MSRTQIFISKKDHQILSYLIRGITSKSETLTRLRGELARAVIVDTHTAPRTSIGLNTWFELEDLDTGEREAYTLSLPADADLANSRLSVLTPIGVGILGYEQGDEVEWPTPGGMRHLKVLKVEGPKDPNDPGQNQGTRRSS